MKAEKNRCSSKTTQRIKTRLVPLHWQGPVHSIDTGIVDLKCSRGCPQRKTTKICCLYIEGATHSTYNRHPSALKAAMATNIRHAAAGSCSFPMVQKSCQRCFIEGTENDDRKYMIRSRLSNVSDCHVKLHLVQAGIDARAPVFSSQTQWTQPSFLW